MEEMKVLTEHIKAPEQYKLAVYQQNGGYQAIRKAIPSIAP